MERLFALMVVLGIVAVLGLYFLFTILFLVFGYLNDNLSLFTGGVLLLCIWFFILRKPKQKDQRV